MMDVVQILFLALPVYGLLQLYTLTRFTGPLKTLTRLSAWVMVVILAYTLVGLWQGANLWPLVLLFSSPLLLGYQVMLVLWWLSRGRGH